MQIRFNYAKSNIVISTFVIMTKFTESVADLLQKPYVMDIIVTIGDNPDCSKSKAVGIMNARTRYLRIDELVEWGIVDAQSPNGQYNACKLNLTEWGKVLYTPMKEIYSIAQAIQREEDGKIQS